MGSGAYFQRWRLRSDSSKMPLMASGGCWSRNSRFARHVRDLMLEVEDEMMLERRIGDRVEDKEIHTSRALASKREPRTFISTSPRFATRDCLLHLLPHLTSHILFSHLSLDLESA